MTKRNRTAALMLCLAAVPAAAQNFRDGVESEGVDPLAQRVMHDFGRCVAQAQPYEVRAMLAAEPGSEDYKRAANKIGQYSGRCVLNGGRLRMRGLPFAGSIAEGALMSGRENAGWEVRVAFDPAKPAYAARSEVDGLAACAVLYAPNEVKTLFATMPTTEQERSAFAALTPTIQKCLREGQTAKIDRMTLRSLMAVTAYRIARTNMAAASAKRS